MQSTVNYCIFYYVMSTCFQTFNVKGIVSKLISTDSDDSKTRRPKSIISGSLSVQSWWWTSTAEIPHWVNARHPLLAPVIECAEDIPEVIENQSNYCTTIFVVLQQIFVFKQLFSTTTLRVRSVTDPQEETRFASLRRNCLDSYEKL